MNMQENQYKKQGKHRKTQETEIQKKIPKRRKKIPKQFSTLYKNTLKTCIYQYKL